MQQMSRNKKIWDQILCFTNLYHCTKFQVNWNSIAWDITQNIHFAQKFDLLTSNCRQTRIFGMMTLMPVWSLYLVLTLCKKWKKVNEGILRYFEKCWFLGQFWPFDPNFRTIRIFVKNPALSLFIIYDPLTSCKKLEKVNERILRSERCGRTDGRTELIL